MPNVTAQANFSDFFSSYTQEREEKIKSKLQAPEYKKVKRSAILILIILVPCLICLFVLYLLSLNGNIILLNNDDSINFEICVSVSVLFILIFVFGCFAQHNATKFSNMYHQIDTDMRLYLWNLLKISLSTDNKPIKTEDFRKKLANDSTYLEKIDILIDEAQKRKNDCDPFTHFTSIGKSLTIIGTLFVSLSSSLLGGSEISFVQKATILVLISVIAIVVAFVSWTSKDFVRVLLAPAYTDYEKIIIQLKEIKTFDQRDFN